MPVLSFGNHRVPEESPRKQAQAPRSAPLTSTASFTQFYNSIPVPVIILIILSSSSSSSSTSSIHPSRKNHSLLPITFRALPYLFDIIPTETIFISNDFLIGTAGIRVIALLIKSPLPIPFLAGSPIDQSRGFLSAPLSESIAPASRAPQLARSKLH